jgi:hypothetical protein
MYSVNYNIGDLVLLSPSEVIYTNTTHNCESGPAESLRFGLAVDDGVTALILDINEEPNVFGEIMFLVGLQKCYMSYHAEGRPELKIIGKIGEKQ